MTSHDPELRRLLIQELERHLLTLDARPRDFATAQRAVHALKGSAGLAGERELAAALERLHRRIREGDEAAFEDVASLVRAAVPRLVAGDPAVVAMWPVPPDDLGALPLDSLVRAQYAAEVTERLARIDDALAEVDDPIEAVRALYRHVHTMKGAASAARDEPMGWFCHGLEERLKNADSTERARAAMKEVASWRVILGGLLDQPDTALATLRARTSTRSSSVPPARPIHPLPIGSSTRPLDADAPRSAFDEATATIRVAASDVERLLDRFDVIDRVREVIASQAGGARDAASALRELRSSLVEALHLIGPPRPWGAPAAAIERISGAVGALGGVGEDVDAAFARIHAAEHALRDGVAEAKKQLSTMRQMAVGRLFARLTIAVESEARRSGRAVIVRTRGADETIDRRIAEHLVEPCLQLVRNAVAHGIETPEARAAQGKSPSGTIALTARKVGHRLSVTIEDDGAGVNVADVRARAIEAGLVTGPIADAADDDTLLSLLYFPGFSTRESSDWLAGRGIGLDIARSGIHRMGGVIRLSSRAGEGFSARIDVPMETGLVTVLWVTAGGEEYALPAANARRVRKNDRASRYVPHLLACLDQSRGGHADLAVDLEVPGDASTEAPAVVGVDAVGRTEPIYVRPLGPLVAGLGPFAGAIARGDGSLRLALDPWAIAPRARAIARASEASPSGSPPPGAR